MDEIEIFGAAGYDSKHSHMMRQEVLDLLCPQRPFTSGIKARSGD
jgi:hypothetical protein